MIGQTISHYKILEKLGEGGMGVVYKAHDTKLDRIVALKFLPHYLTSDAQEKERFYHEARAASALMHPNVTVIHEINEHDGQLFLAMEYVEGKTLRKLVEEDTLSVKKVLDIVIQCCDGLAAAHEKGIVHRDIKSDNIMITPKGQVKIMDFGLAKLKGSTKLTKLGSTLGTAAYMSPEQAQGEDVDPRSDIFSFGVVFYELLTTKLPFKGEHQAALMYSLINEPPPPIARFNEKVTPDLERIVMKALAKDREERYQHIDELLADVRRERKQMEYARAGYASMPSMPAAAPAAPAKKNGMLRYLIPTGAIIGVLLVLVIFNPFNFQLSTQKSAAAEHNSIAVMYFENVADPQDQDKTAKMITSLLTTGLSESKSLNVMSTQRLYDILKQLGKDDSKVLDKGVASEVAKKAGVSLVVTGEVLQSKPNIVLTAEVSEVEGGKILAAEKIAGSPGDDVFAVVDKLGANIRMRLLPAPQPGAEPEKAVADVTTHSPEAYKEYLQGLEDFAKLYKIEAIRHFEKAIAIDSTFAMAYFRIAQFADDRTRSRTSFQMALKFSDRLTLREREYLKGWEPVIVDNNFSEAIVRLKEYVRNYPDDKEGYLALGISSRLLKDYPTSISALTKVIELDPFFKDAYNLMAYVYDELGNFDKSIWAIDKYISLAPDEPNPYDSRGDLFAKHGNVKEATDSYKKALSLKSDFYESLEKLGQMSAYSGNFAAADSCFRILAGSKEHIWRWTGQHDLVCLAQYQGKFKTALEGLQGLLGGQAGKPSNGDEADVHDAISTLYDAMHDYVSAAREAGQAVKILQRDKANSPVFGRHWYGYTLARKGDLLEAQAVADDLRRDIEKADTGQMDAYWRIIEEIERKKGNLPAALSASRRAAGASESFYRHLSLGRIELEVKKLGEAVAEFQRLDEDHFNPSRFGNFGTILHYHLGVAYEQSGWTDKAIGEYEKFLDILKNADTAIPEIADARQRLAKLKHKI
jgi:serine/threonine protein kinase/Flp pilus assembly protein TadD